MWDYVGVPPIPQNPSLRLRDLCIFVSFAVCEWFGNILSIRLAAQQIWRRVHFMHTKELRHTLRNWGN